MTRPLPVPPSRLLATGAFVGLVWLGCGARSAVLDGVFDEGAGGAGGQPSSASVSTASGTTVTSAVSTTAVTATTGTGAGGSDCLPEVCDGLDNDCDGAIDEGCECVPGEVLSCYSGPPETLGVGTCMAGFSTCQPDGTWAPCQGEVTPAPEVCNGLDDDCDGVVDGVCSTGCADGEREGYLDESLYPSIAACAGGWSTPGILGAQAPSCGLSAGDDGGNPSGAGCSVADLCAPGFHVCTGADDVAKSSPTGCAGATSANGQFFATRQSGPGCGICALGSDVDPNVCNGCSCAANCAPSAIVANDVFGCGTLGADAGNCGVLDRFSGNGCDGLGAPWSCPAGCDEANGITKSGSGAGGVLCCAD